jgi:hypothetical protein
MLPVFRRVFCNCMDDLPCFSSLRQGDGALGKVPNSVSVALTPDVLTSHIQCTLECSLGSINRRHSLRQVVRELRVQVFLLCRRATRAVGYPRAFNCHTHWHHSRQTLHIASSPRPKPTGNRAEWLWKNVACQNFEGPMATYWRFHLCCGGT